MRCPEFIRDHGIKELVGKRHMTGGAGRGGGGSTNRKAVPVGWGQMGPEALPGSCFSTDSLLIIVC